MASAIDVPVYIILVISPFDRADKSVIDQPALQAQLGGPIGVSRALDRRRHLCRGRAGRTSQAARQIVTELRHQFLFAFEPSTQPGWHPINLRTRDKDFIVRARTGYFVQSQPTQGQ